VALNLLVSPTMAFEKIISLIEVFPLPVRFFKDDDGRAGP
jgi:hypothetical protein